MICEWCRKEVKYRYKFCKNLFDQGKKIKDVCPFEFMPKEDAERFLYSMIPPKKVKKKK